MNAYKIIKTQFGYMVQRFDGSLVADEGGNACFDQYADALVLYVSKTADALQQCDKLLSELIYSDNI